MEDADQGVRTGALLRQARKKKGLSLREAADRLGDGTHFTTLGKLERGLMVLSFDWAQRLAKVYGVTPADLWFYEASSDSVQKVPVYLYDAPENFSGEPADWKQFGWFFTSYGSPNSFAVLVGLVDDITGKTVEHYAVIDPKFFIFRNGAKYALQIVVSAAENYVFIGTYSEEDQSFTGVPPFSEGRIVTGHLPFKRLGRVALLAEAHTP